jgi:hypothetical protein
MTYATVGFLSRVAQDMEKSTALLFPLLVKTRNLQQLQACGDAINTQGKLQPFHCFQVNLWLIKSSSFTFFFASGKEHNNEENKNV